MKLKKWLSILLILVLCLTLVACGRKKGEAEPTAQQNTELSDQSEEPENIIQEDDEPLINENGEEVPSLEIAPELVIELEENQGTGGL